MLIYPKLKKIVPALVILCIASLLFPTIILAQEISGPRVVVNVEYLNQRTGPGPQYMVQGVHGGGVILPVIGRTDSGDWWQVNSQFGAGWLNNEHVAIRGDLSHVPVVTEYGQLEQPKAISLAYPVPAYQLPNPGSLVVGMTMGEAGYPIIGRSYHTGTETWYWLVNTTAGTVWLEDTEQIAIWGFAMDVPLISTEVAFDLERTAPVADGIVRPPEPPPILEVPTAPAETDSQGTAEGGTVVTEQPMGPVNYITIADTQMRLMGDCYSLPLVNYLIQQSPVRATALTCTDNATGTNRLLLGLADLSMSVDGGCGGATETPIAMLYEADGTSHALSFCTNAPNVATSTFVNWVKSPTGGAAIQTFRGLPTSPPPQYAMPMN